MASEYEDSIAALEDRLARLMAAREALADVSLPAVPQSPFPRKRIGHYARAEGFYRALGEEERPPTMAELYAAGIRKDRPAPPRPGPRPQAVPIGMQQAASQLRELIATTDDTIVKLSPGGAWRQYAEPGIGLRVGQAVGAVRRAVGMPDPERESFRAAIQKLKIQELSGDQSARSISDFDMKQAARYTVDVGQDADTMVSRLRLKRRHFVNALRNIERAINTQTIEAGGPYAPGFGREVQRWVGEAERGAMPQPMDELEGSEVVQ